jgi:hypothetical protein
MGGLLIKECVHRYRCVISTIAKFYGRSVVVRGVRIWVYPLVRGEGKRLFENGVAPGSFRGTTPSTWIATFATA